MDRDDWLSPGDRFLVRLDRIGFTVPLVMVAILDGKVDRSRMTARHEESTQKVRRFRQVMVEPRFTTAPPFWSDDPHFDSARHIRFEPAGDGGRRALLDRAATFAAAPFDPDVPPWGTVVLEDFEGGRTAVLRRQHHALIDGMGMVAIVQAFVDFEREPPRIAEAPLPPLAPLPSARRVAVAGWNRELTRLRQVLITAARGTRALATTPDARRNAVKTLHALSILARDRGKVPLSPVMRGRSDGARLDVLEFEFDGFRRGAKLAGGTVNDGFLAGIAAAMRRYHEAHGGPCGALRTSMPINTRSDAERGLPGNFLSGVRLDLPLGGGDPAARIRAVRDVVAAKRADGTEQLYSTLSGLLARMPSRVLIAALGARLRATDIVCSNVAGPPIPLWLAGLPIQSSFGFGPRVGAAVNITMRSAAGMLMVSVNSDPAAVPDPEFLVQCLRESFAEIAAISTPRAPSSP